jgi:hypothetical protein
MNPLDEGINPYQSIGWTLRSETGIVISQRAPLDLLWGNAMRVVEDFYSPLQYLDE